MASSNANHPAPAAVALSHAIWTVTPARREAASCWQACKKWFLDPVISSPDSITKSLDRPSTSLSASLAGEPLATLKTETAYRALIKPSFSPILLLDLHHNRIAWKVSDHRLNAQCGDPCSKLGWIVTSSMACAGVEAGEGRDELTAEQVAGPREPDPAEFRTKRWNTGRPSVLEERFQ